MTLSSFFTVALLRIPDSNFPDFCLLENRTSDMSSDSVETAIRFQALEQICLGFNMTLNVSFFNIIASIDSDTVAKEIERIRTQTFPPITGIGPIVSTYFRFLATDLAKNVSEWGPFYWLILLIVALSLIGNTRSLSAFKVLRRAGAHVYEYQVLESVSTKVVGSVSSISDERVHPLPPLEALDPVPSTPSSIAPTPVCPKPKTLRCRWR